MKLLNDDMLYVDNSMGRRKQARIDALCVKIKDLFPRKGDIDEEYSI